MKPHDIRAYRLVRNFAGSNSTYLAESKEDGALAILKIFPGELIDADSWSEICSQFRGVQLKEGPVCWISEIGLQGGHVYAVAPYLEGETLAQVIKGVNQHREVTQQPSHHRAVACLVAELIRGLLARGSDEFHHAVFDRDMVTPGELFVLRDGSVRVLDSRWAWLRARTSGSPWSSLERNLAYMAPTTRRAQRASDAGRAWALSVMLWELLTGYRLFRRNTLESTLHAVAGCEVPDPRLINASVPEALALLSMRALSAPGAVPLTELRSQLLVWLGNVEGDGRGEIKAWLDALFPDDAPTVTVDEIDGGDAPDSASWSAVEESTTCIALPPPVQDGGLVQLSWLEGEAMPHISTVPPSRAPDRHRVARGLGVAALVALASLGFWGSTSLHGTDAPAGERQASLAEPWSVPAFMIQTESKTKTPLAQAPSAALEAASPGSLTLDEIPVREAGDAAEPAPIAEAISQSSSPAPRSAPRRQEASRVVATTGDILVRAPAGTRVSVGGRSLGQGTFRTRLPAGQHVLRAEGPTGTTTYTAFQVVAGTIGVVEAN